MTLLDYFLIPFFFDACISANLVVVNLVAQDLDATPLNLGVMGFLWGGLYGLFAFVAGRLSHRLPHRAAMIGGMSCFCVAVVAAQFATQPWHLYITQAVNGVGCAFVWPLFEELLHDHDQAAHARKMTCFNVGWPVGLTMGTAASGFLKARSTPFAINTVAAVVACLALYFLWRTRHGLPQVPVGPEDMPAEAVAEQRGPGYFLYVTWLALLAMWAAGGVVYSLFPKLARDLRFPEQSVGVLMALMVGSQAITSSAICLTRWWRHRLLPILITQTLGGAALLIIAGGAGYLAFGGAMLLLGVGRAMCYASSLHYGLSDPVKRSRNMGTHEMLIGTAFAVGPLIGGIAASYVTLRFAFRLAAYWVGASVIGLVIIEAVLRQRASRGVAENVKPQPSAEG